ncbi:MAG TPA: GAF domain-containing protein, partial [Candidatus Omnitrophota bacterium]|nr:GAF domain-containing protein [Candidatus Omnitrophota bacterium]
MEETKDHIYQTELFERLKKSAGLKTGQESFGCYLKPTLWWIIEKPNPKIHEMAKVISGNCACLKKAKGRHTASCLKNVHESIKAAAKEKKLVTFDCREGLHGFVYPIIQGEKHYGYIGACYAKKDISPQILDIFSNFTDTIVREIQKELELSKLYETIRPRAIALSTVHTVHRLISSTLNLPELLPRVARLSLQIMRANRCSIKLVDAKKKTLLPKATIDLREKRTRLKKVKVGKYAPGKAVKFGRPIRGEDFLATPLIDEDVIGVITLYDKVDDKPFTAFDQEIMSTLAEQAVIAIKNAQLYKEQERLTLGSIKSLAAVLESRAPGTYVPKASFLKIAIAIGQDMRLDPESLKSLEYAAILHDAGEIFVPDKVLSKPDKLTGKEYEMVKEHPAAEVTIIRHIKALKDVV